MRIGLDVDEVLAGFLRGMLPWLAEHHGIRVSWHDMYSYEFYEAWHVPEGVAREIIDRFLESRAFKELDVVPGSRQGVGCLADRHDVVVVTSRPRYVGEVTRRWLRRRFGDVFGEVLLTNSHGVGESTSKAALVEEHGVDVLVDDNPAYCNDVVGVGARAVLVSKPWNRGADLRRGVDVVVSWDAVPGLVEWMDT